MKKSEVKNEADRSLHQHHSHDKEKIRVGWQFLNPTFRSKVLCLSLNHKAVTDFVEEEYGVPHEKKFWILLMKW